jgi:hypothetical protein
MVPVAQISELAMPSPRSALKRSAEQTEVEARTTSPRSSASEAVARREATVQIAMPRLTLNQINVMGSLEAERRVQVVQGQVVRLEADVQSERQHFRAEAAAASEGRAQERKIYEEAFVFADENIKPKWTVGSKNASSFRLNLRTLTHICVIVNNKIKTKSCIIKSKPLFCSQKPHG